MIYTSIGISTTQHFSTHWQSSLNFLPLYSVAWINFSQLQDSIPLWCAVIILPFLFSFLWFPPRPSSDCSGLLKVCDHYPSHVLDITHYSPHTHTHTDDLCTKSSNLLHVSGRKMAQTADNFQVRKNSPLHRPLCVFACSLGYWEWILFIC